jgi:hypothetical protein
MFSDTFVQLSPISMAQLHCFALRMLQRKAWVHHLDIRESRSPIYDHGQFSSKLKFRNGPLSLPKKKLKFETKIDEAHPMNGWWINLFPWLSLYPKKFNLCMCFPVRTIFIHILLVIWSKLRCRRTSSDGFKYSSIPCIVPVQCSLCLTCHENVGWFVC